MQDQQHAVCLWTSSRRQISSSQEPTCSCLAMDFPLLADLERESPRNLCTSRKDLSLLAVKGLPDLCDVKEALLEEGPGPASLDDEEASGEWDREAARLRLAMMRAVESASAAGRDDDFSSLVFGEPAHAKRGMYILTFVTFTEGLYASLCLLLLHTCSEDCLGMLVVSRISSMSAGKHALTLKNSCCRLVCKQICVIGAGCFQCAWQCM